MNKKGFTLIELLTVIAILGILVLLAAPKFLGYTEKANIAKIQTGIKAVETAIDLKSLENPDLTKNWDVIESTDLQEINDSGKLIDKKGHIKEDLEGGKKIPLKNLDVKWKSGGEFILDADGESVYYYYKNIKVSKGEDGSVMLPDGTVITVTLESNFTWVNDSDGYTATGQSETGYYKYTGTGEEVVNIPHVIKGTEMTSYYQMFESSGADVKKVISTNPEITDMRKMFYESNATSLDLSSFDTSNVTNMSRMFQGSQATSLDLSSFDTFKVADMSWMFYLTQATTLDLGSFDTSNVTTMSAMFYNSKATSLDLSSFDTSKVSQMASMFYQSQTTTGYARTQTDADKLNASSGKPSGLNFTLK